MRLEDHLNRAREHSSKGDYTMAIEQLSCAVQVSAGGGPSIYSARKAIKEAFIDDPKFRDEWLNNISNQIMGFEQQRFGMPGIALGPMTTNERVMLAERILRLIFEV